MFLDFNWSDFGSPLSNTPAITTSVDSVYLVAFVGLEEAPHPGLAKVCFSELVIDAVDAGIRQYVAIATKNTLQKINNIKRVIANDG